MSPESASLIVLSGLFVLLALGMPIAFALGVMGLVGYWAITDINVALAGLRIIPFTVTGRFEFSVIPLFILMGEFVFFAGVSRDMFFAAQKWLGRMPGGLAMSTVAAASGFAAASGSSLATAATIGRIAVPEMIRQGYHRKFASGVIAAGGTLGILIPPSTPILVFAIITEQSAGKLLMAGLLPGILSAVIYLGSIYIRAARSPSLAPRVEAGVSWRERFLSLKDIWAIGLLVAVVLGGIFFGVWTPTEAAAGGAFVAMLLGVFLLRRLGLRQIGESLWRTTQTTSMIFLLLVAAGLLGHFLAGAKIPDQLVELISSLPIPHLGVVIMLLAFYIFIGTFFSVFETLIITLPIVFPVILAFGFDPIWFTILIIKTMEVGLITPPFGLNVFIIKGVAPDIPLEDVFRGIWPFFLMDIFTISILVAFPAISTWLPSMMKM
jgi:tripartite ATP-independent transporter DctM subunit